jgi:four helix bundle protein
MKFNKFEEIIAWQKAQELTILLYKKFSGARDYSFRDQILRASTSIMNNIAEGFERKSNKDFSKFLFIAKGSCGEVRSMVHLGFSLKYIAESESTDLINRTIEISKMLSGLIKVLRI